MQLPPDHLLDLLAVLTDERPMRTLIARLREAGFGVDTAQDLEGARASFFGAGGHHCLMVGPDVPEAFARAVVASLRAVDPDLPALSFGPALPGAGAPNRTTALRLHPGTRAGAGALLRFLRALPDRN